jgi:lipopolysaccharide/colanic/teichoic acid biosynthesis glycosyltransferase
MKSEMKQQPPVLPVKEGHECIMAVTRSRTEEISDGNDIPWRLIRRAVGYVATLVNQRLYRAGGKRALDLVGGCVLLVLVFPVLCITWLAVRLTSRGPAIFAQERIGLHGKRFVFYKFRSMYVDQESRVDMKKIKEGEAMGLLYKPDNDPRVTPVGRFIRKTSIDELPQLWNVMRGDMSLVGPRPLVSHMVEPYPEIMKRRSEIRPGVTGLWQVSAREDNTSVLGMVKYDVDYVNNYSMLADLLIVLKTPLAVILGHGAK